jgi:hypothetical protein
MANKFKTVTAEEIIESEREFAGAYAIGAFTDEQVFAWSKLMADCQNFGHEAPIEMVEELIEKLPPLQIKITLTIIHANRKWGFIRD